LKVGEAALATAPGPRPVASLADPRPAGRLRVLAGPHDDWFDGEALAALERTAFTVSPHSNRVGYRLTAAAPLPRQRYDEMISDATWAGAIQVPPDGQPILLMADRQVTGGYPILATVISADLPLAAQLAPGDAVRFEVCTRAAALAALRQAAS
jgi:allophanate hydrolase subunit 2